MSNTPEARSESLLVEWANGEAAFIRQIVFDVMASKARPAESDIDRYFELLLREKHLHAEPAPAVPLIPQTGITSGAAEEIRLTSMKVTAGVNALKNDETLEFGTNLTVVYGENGSGKSGYVRVLKRAAGVVRSAEQILGNIHKISPPMPSATFQVSVAGKPVDPIVWSNEEGLAPFTQIAVFDSKSVGAYVDDDLTYVYTPGELALFPVVQETIERVRERLNLAVTKSSDVRNPFLVQFKRGTTVYPLIEKLGAATDLVRLKQLATLSDAERAHKTQLEAEIEALRSTDVNAQLKVVEDQSRTVKSVVRALKAVIGFDREAYQRAIAAQDGARTREKQVSENAFSGLGIPGVLSDAWKAFIDAGEQYLQRHHADVPFPHESEVCVYCRQPLDAASVDLIEKYREFSSGEARRHLAEARNELNKLSSSVVSLDLLGLVADLGAEISSGRGRALESLVAPLTTAGQLRDAVVAQASALPVTADATDAATAADEIAAKLDETVTALRTKSAERTTLLSQRQTELTELEARTVLETLWGSIERKVVDAKWANEAGVVARGFTSTSRALTDQAKAATQALLNTTFEQRFAEESAALRAPTVILEFPGARGQAMRRKVVGQHRPGEVLSEGEQKVIAIADFLAETRVRQPNGPVIFDDPVNSLDYRRAEEVATRIRALALTNQVVVFTHSVMFASMLLEGADKKVTTYVDIKNDGAPGIVSVGTHPRTDSASNLLSRLDIIIVAAKKATGEVQEALVYKGFDILRALTEVISEHGLLKAVSERYRANVRVETLERINIAELDDCIKKVVACYRKSCRYIEAHSQPMDHLGMSPTLTELESELGVMKDVMKTHPV